MSGETTVTVIGNLPADPELRTLSNGTNVAGFTVASTPRQFNRNTNQYEDGNALFMRCSAWKDLADHCAQSLGKGMRVIVQGRLQQRTYQAKDGSNRTVVELQVDEIGPSLRYATAQVTRVQQGNGFNGQQYQGGFAGAQRNQPAPQQAPAQPPVQPPIGGGVPSDPWSQSQAANDFGFDTDPSF